MWLAFCLLIVVLVLWIWNSAQRPRNFPPGPFWFPWFGTTLQARRLGRKYGGLHGVYRVLSERYRSPVIGLRQGSENIVAVYGYPVAKEALTNDLLSGRPDNTFTRLRTLGERLGIAFTDGQHWEEHRSFVVRTLKEVGLGKSSMEESIQRELQELIDVIKSDGQGMFPRKMFQVSVLNVLWTFASGKRIGKGNMHLNDLLDTLKKRLEMFDIAGGLLNQVPWLQYIAPEWSGYNIVKRFSYKLIDFFTDTISEHKANFREDKAATDLIYAYMREIKAREHDPNSTFTETQMIMAILDLFIAGATTTALVVELGLLIMISRPDINAKVNAEIDAYQEPITWESRHSLPYIQALLAELQRYFHSAAISGPRRALQDTTLGGYSIPKDTSVFVDLRSVHMDPEYWGDPETFRPERFIDEQGNFVQNERLIPFSLGKRRCLGDSLARVCFFVYFAGLMQRFQVYLPNGVSEYPSMKLMPGITYMPKEFQVSFKEKTTKNVIELFK
ncbi:probable cytochrome P450 305a1 [Uranotaenia lowii]|uniref:probable cytochrome P450 305a1 n=1 Tax=Uranotaenia lowii TaxID=190385 RepID=UPI0024789A99|nr:probable cytochrome P450 305a1 [Uranotaenia lowii]